MLVVEFGDRSYIQSDAEIKKKTTRGLWLVVKEQPWQLSGRYSSQRCWKVSRAVLPWQGYPLGYGEMLLLFSPSVVSNAVTPWTAAHQASLSFTISWSLFKLMPIELVMPSNRLILCPPLLLPPLVFPSIRVFSNESALRIRWPKYWSSGFSQDFVNFLIKYT